MKVNRSLDEITPLTTTRSNHYGTSESNGHDQVEVEETVILDLSERDEKSKSSESKLTLEDLPDEMLKEIFGHLLETGLPEYDLRMQTTLSLVNKRFYRVVHEPKKDALLKIGFFNKQQEKIVLDDDLIEAKLDKANRKCMDCGNINIFLLLALLITGVPDILIAMADPQTPLESLLFKILTPTFGVTFGLFFYRTCFKWGLDCIIESDLKNDAKENQRVKVAIQRELPELDKKLLGESGKEADETQPLLEQEHVVIEVRPERGDQRPDPTEYTATFHPFGSM